MYHSESVNFIKNHKLPLVTTIASITETLHLLDFNRNAQIDFIEWVYRGAVEIQNIENNDFGRIKELTEKYHDLPMDFADSCLVYLAEKMNLNTIATIDRDFSNYRINGRRKFRIILS
jgi:predicted nucleic acid-binding protein